MKNSIGRDLTEAVEERARRDGAGEGAHQDNVKGNSSVQRDGTPTNLGAPPTKPTAFFKVSSAPVSSGMEKALGALADKLHVSGTKRGR